MVIRLNDLLIDINILYETSKNIEKVKLAIEYMKELNISSCHDINFLRSKTTEIVFNTKSYRGLTNPEDLSQNPTYIDYMNIKKEKREFLDYTIKQRMLDSMKDNLEFRNNIQVIIKFNEWSKFCNIDKDANLSNKLEMYYIFKEDLDIWLKYHFFINSIMSFLDSNQDIRLIFK